MGCILLKPCCSLSKLIYSITLKIGRRFGGNVGKKRLKLSPDVIKDKIIRVMSWKTGFSIQFINRSKD